MGILSSAIGAVGSVVNGIINAQGAKKQREWEESQAQQQQQWNEQMMDKQNQFNVNMWNAQNEYNDPSAQYQRLLNSGFNPMYYGPEGSGNAEGMTSAQPLGYERARNVQNPLQAGLEGFNQARALQKDIELKNAQIDKLSEETDSTKLDNEWKDKTMEARVQAEELANNLSKENAVKVRKEMSQIDANIKKVIAETENEALKGLLIEAQTAVQKASEKQIVELLPYEKLLKEAQTEAQKASASASYLNALTQRGLLDAGYIDHYINGLAQDARYKSAIADSNEAQASINAFKSAVRNGTLWTIEDDDWFGEKLGKMFWNNVISGVSTVGEALTGGLSGVLK